jgi:hypothetical protein
MLGIENFGVDMRIFGEMGRNDIYTLGGSVDSGFFLFSETGGKLSSVLGPIT